jgi:hypothetical protein
MSFGTSSGLGCPGGTSCAIERNIDDDWLPASLPQLSPNFWTLRPKRYRMAALNRA